MAYSETTRLLLKKAVVGTNQPFETAVFNDNLDKIDAEAVAIDARLDTAESDINSLESQLTTTNSNVTTVSGSVTTLAGRVTTAENDIDNLQAIVGVTTTVRTVSGTVDTLLTGDKNNVVVFTSGSDVTVSVPNILTAGQRIDIVQDGAGLVNFVAGSGVTLQGLGTKTSAQYAAATVLCVSSGQYRLIGSLAV